MHVLVVKLEEMGERATCVTTSLIIKTLMTSAFLMIPVSSEAK